MSRASLERRRFLKTMGVAGLGVAMGACDSAVPVGASPDTDDAGGETGSDAGAHEDAPSSGRRSLAIVGGGAAGVFTAWLLDGAYDVTLFEAASTLGGNVRTISVPYRTHTVTLDMGAQYFNPGPYPTYTRLLEHLGLHVPTDRTRSDTFESPSSISLLAPGEETPRFVSPIAVSRTWPSSEAWNRDGLLAFSIASARSPELERDADWGLTTDQWFRDIGLSDVQRERIMLPWIASLYSGRLEHAPTLSARAAMTFLTRVVSESGISSVTYFVLASGMGAVLDRLVGDCATLEVRTASPVESVTRDGARLAVRVGGDVAGRFDEVVVAAPGGVAATVLDGLPEARELAAALRGIEWHDAALALHADPIYASANARDRSFLNVLVDGEGSEASMSMAEVLPPLPGGERVDLWKSWTTLRSALPADLLYEARYTHMLPSVATLAAQKRVRDAQRSAPVRVVGGYTRHYDSQETCLVTAMEAAAALAPDARNLATLRALVPG